MTGMVNWEETNQKVIAAFRANQGKVGGFFAGSRLLLMHTTGARTGTPYVIPLSYLPDGERFVVFASNTGAPRHPAWFYNVMAHPDVTIEVGEEILSVTASVAQEPERGKLFARMAAEFHRYGEYQQKTERVIPAVILTRNRKELSRRGPWESGGM